jgi:hypothetical protein
MSRWICADEYRPRLNRAYVAMDGDVRPIPGFRSRGPAESLHVELHFIAELPDEFIPARTHSVRDVCPRSRRERVGELSVINQLKD